MALLDSNPTDMYPGGDSRCAPVLVCQSRMVLSPEADASVLPSGENATALTGVLLASQFHRHLQGSGFILDAVNCPRI